MRIIGLFDHYFLIMIFAQYLVSNLIDVNKIKAENHSKEATILKRASLTILIVSVALFGISRIYK